MHVSQVKIRMHKQNIKKCTFHRSKYGCINRISKHARFTGQNTDALTEYQNMHVSQVKIRMHKQNIKTCTFHRSKYGCINRISKHARFTGQNSDSQAEYQSWFSRYKNITSLNLQQDKECTN